MVPKMSPLRVYVVPFLPSKFVLGSTLPSGLIVRLSGSCALTGEVKIKTDAKRPIRTSDSANVVFFIQDLPSRLCFLKYTNKPAVATIMLSSNRIFHG